MKIVPLSQVTKAIAKTSVLYGNCGEIVGDGKFLPSSKIPVTVTVWLPDHNREPQTMPVQMTDGKITATFAGEPFATQITVNVDPIKIELPPDVRVEKVFYRVDDNSGKVMYVEPPRNQRPATLFARITGDTDFPNLNGKSVFVPIRYQTGHILKYFAA